MISIHLDEIIYFFYNTKVNLQNMQYFFFAPVYHCCREIFGIIFGLMIAICVKQIVTSFFKKENEIYIHLSKDCSSLKHSFQSLVLIITLSGVSSMAVPGVPWHTQIFADKLNLSQPGGADYAHHITTGIPGFSDPPPTLNGMNILVRLDLDIIHVQYLFVFQNFAADHPFNV